MEFSEQIYQALLQDLFAKHPSVQTQGFHQGAYKPGLHNMQELDYRLGSPWKQYPIIHIAGTNGKGSVSSMIAAGLASQGYKIGLYTSPHLVDFRERIKIIEESGYELVSKQFVYDFVSNHNLDGLSFFEITTALAFSYFAQQKVDYAVIESGLGGRLDSTNIVIPILSVITSIGLDHCALLGNSVQEIAAEKAGIIKPGIPVIIGSQDSETAPVFRAAAERNSAQLYFADEAELKFPDFNEVEESFDLKGPYQQDNIRTALKALELIGKATQYQALRHTAEVTGLRGRWELIQDANPMIICDIGHNPAALEINFKRLLDMKRPLFIVYGVMADKDYTAVRALMPTRARYYGVAPKSSRALGTAELAQVLEGLDFSIEDSVAQGARRAIEDAAGVQGSVVYIGGSNFVVAEYLESVLRK